MKAQKSMMSDQQSSSVKPVNELVDAVFVLSVKTLSARIQHIESELARKGIVFSFMFEHDAAELSEDRLTEIFGPSEMKLTHKSLVMKNIQVWKNSVAQGYERVLVFEDDAVLGDNFMAGFTEAMVAVEKLPPGWLVFLGGLDTKVPDSYFLAPGPLVELPIATTEACVYDKQAMLRRLNWLESNKVTLSVDHLMRHIDAVMRSPQYWLRQPIVEQGSVIGVFDSLLDGGRQKHGRTFNVLRNRWNKFRRRRLREWLVKLKSLVHQD
ncbi:MAG: glycosyltransferase family 25 protein [Azonexus sp.]|nr:glycosyltransferase family 25 protein [Azonexus sp.]